MTQVRITSIIMSIYQYKYLINKDNFVWWNRQAFHRRAQSARLKMNLRTLTDMHGACSGVFL